MRRVGLLGMGILAAGCKPDFGLPQSLVMAPAIVAVRGEPAEVRPGDDVRFTLLAIGPDGTDETSEVDWSLCLQPKPLDENNIVADACLGGGDAVQPVGAGREITATVPLDACARFGPDPPPQKPGEPALRPRDPDVTGGYYQPMRANTLGTIGFGLERITCNLAGAGADVTSAFGMRYRANTNPVLLPLAASVTGNVAPGQKVSFTVAWTPESVESYPVYDAERQTLVDHREAMRVAWFATAGSFVHEHTGRTEDERDTSTDNEWTAPSQPGPVHLWWVLRDSRGGTAFDSTTVTVAP